MNKPTQGSTRDYCSAWPGSPHHMVTHMGGVAHMPVRTVDQCSQCEWIDFEALNSQMQEPRKNKALDIAYRYAQIDGGHHKAWVIDQMVRALTDVEYDQWITDYRAGEDGPDTYDWDTGIAP